MAPKAYIEARLKAKEERHIIDRKPYLPFLKVDPADVEGVKQVAAQVMGCPSSELQVKVVTGGITNALYRVTGLVSDDQSALPHSCLVRVFGGEGLIDRDVENATYAALSEAQLAPTYWGRFGNGRVEAWLDMRPLKIRELSIPDISKGIAIAMGKFHAEFLVPDHLTEYHDPSQPTLWKQLRDWTTQALEHVQASRFKTEEQVERARALNLTRIPDELEWLQTKVAPADARVAFCHNDLLAANILYDDETKNIQLIDFEYGGINYSSFDIANHFNEYAGGTEDGVPNYDWFPSRAQQEIFVQHYLQGFHGSGKDVTKEEVAALLEEVQGFIMANHLYWGTWAINQAATEGCEEFDYLLFGTNRIGRYFHEKAEYQAQHANQNE